MSSSIVHTVGPKIGSIVSQLLLKTGAEASASDEFDAATLDSAWIGMSYNGGSEASAAYDVDAVDSYDTGVISSSNPIRYTLADRPSWLHVQS